MRLIWGSGGKDTLKFASLADGIGHDSSCLDIADEARQPLDIFLAAAALCVSRQGLRMSCILDPSEDQPSFSPNENRECGDSPRSLHTGSDGSE